MNKLFLMMFLPLAMSIVSCKKEDVSITSSAGVQSYQSVVLKGYANGANGNVGFCYSATEADPNPETCPYVETSSIRNDNSYELIVDDLQPNTKYYYRAFATLDSTKVLANEVKTFTTKEFEVVAVDLGLSVKWANCNVGANAPEEYGDYFAWGETEPYYTEGHSQDNPCEDWKEGKSGYHWASYKWCNGSYNTLTKYCSKSSYGAVDNKTLLDAADDAAAVKWGGSWRMPTSDEQQELLDNCTWIWRTLNGVNGYNVVGPNGKSIFLPAAGYRDDNYLCLADSYGYYWTSSLFASVSGAYGLYFNFGNYIWNVNSRYVGLPVRPVCQ